MPTGPRILIVENEPSIRIGIERRLFVDSKKIEVANNAVDALEKFQSGDFQVVISDVHLPGGDDGLLLITQMLKRKPETTAIVMTPMGAIEKATEAMRRGAFDFITKPVDWNLMGQQIKKAMERHRLLAENRALKDRLADVGELSGVVGNSPSMQRVYTQVQQVADSNASVVIYGESGTGKELVARTLHELSSRATEPFVPVNLEALPTTLMERELFGSMVALTMDGSDRPPQERQGCLDQAVSGTLFLDHVSSLSPSCQAELLNRFQSQRGANREECSDLMAPRMISSSKMDLAILVDEKKFHRDLFEQLSIVTIEIPPLRERRSDIPLLVEHFFKHYCIRHNRPPKLVSDDAMKSMVSATWPGNVRQLRNLIERLVVTIGRNAIVATDLPAEIFREPKMAETRLGSLADATENAERDAIRLALRARNFHREETAKALGISLRTLHYKMNRYGLH